MCKKVKTRGVTREAAACRPFCAEDSWELQLPSSCSREIRAAGENPGPEGKGTRPSGIQVGDELKPEQATEEMGASLLSNGWNCLPAAYPCPRCCRNRCLPGYSSSQRRLFQRKGIRERGVERN